MQMWRLPGTTIEERDKMSNQCEWDKLAQIAEKVMESEGFTADDVREDYRLMKESERRL